MQTSVVDQKRFTFVEAAHEFIGEVVPFGASHSKDALVRFAILIDQCHLPRIEAEAVVIMALAALARHTDNRFPSLVDQFLKLRRSGTALSAAFTQSLSSEMKRQPARNERLGAIMHVIEQSFIYPTFNLEVLATTVKLPKRTVAGTLRRHAGSTFSECLRRRRLDRAAELLTKTDLRIKEIWVAAGYNDASNFIHDFKRRFRRTPSDYRVAFAIEETARLALRHESQDRSTLDTLLIVDDNPSTLGSCADYLRSMGHNVVCATSGRQGLELHATACPNAVLVDYVLPDFDGIEWIRAIRARRVGSNTPAVVFSAAFEVAEREEDLKELGATFVSKLSDLDDVMQILHRIARQNEKKGSLK